MKIILLCGYFAPENQLEVIGHSRSTVQFSANLFQEKLIAGLKTVDAEVTVLSAPFIGSYPNESDIRVFKGFSTHQDMCHYVSFNNLWGVRNLSRSQSLKKAIRDFADDSDTNKIILVYAAHTPFIKAAYWAKKRNPKIKVGLFVPDLPNYMNLNIKRNKIYDVLKMFDNTAMYHYMDCVDAFMLLTDAMKNKLPVGSKPYFVAEGIVSSEQFMQETTERPVENKRNIVYTGKLNMKFGIKELIAGFQMLQDSALRLVLCGTGDALTYARQVAMEDDRIQVLGQVTPMEASQWQQRATVLINPRLGNDEYTKYSFPSKNIEYLLTGKPVVSYILDGMPEIYKNFFYPIQRNDVAPQAIALAINAAVSADSVQQLDKYSSFCEYAQENLLNNSIVTKMLHMLR